MIQNKTLQEWRDDLVDSCRVAEEAKDDPKRGYAWAYGYLERAVANFTGACQERTVDADANQGA